MTLTECWHHTTQALSEAGFDNPSMEAKWLITGALGKETAFITLNPNYSPSPQEEKKIQDWLMRRMRGEPLSRLRGVREFWSLSFQLNEHTLDPRPETEILVEGVLKWVGNRTAHPWRILDLGTGSGCLLIALLHELKKATGVGVDISKEALIMARLNASLNQVDQRATFQQGNWGENLEGPFDIIVSNPPYVSLKDKENLEKGVRNFDPPLALFGGEDGLACYRDLAPTLKHLLAPEGLAVVELGYGQRKAVEPLFHAEGVKTGFVLKDLAGIERALGIKPSVSESFPLDIERP